METSLDTQPAHQAIKRQEIHFPQGNRALAVFPSSDTHTSDIVQALSISQPKAVIMITGGASRMGKHVRPDLSQLFTDGIAQVAASNEALIIDGGTQAGVMALIGQGVSKQPRRPVLLGISPAENVTYPGNSIQGSGRDEVPLDPNHSHFVLVESNEWGGETETMYELARFFSQGCPSVAILINGGAIAQNEVLYNVHQERPIIIIEGSGRLADEVARILREKSSFNLDPDLTEIITLGKLYLFPSTGSTLELEQFTQRLLDEQ